MKEQLVTQLKTQITDLERFIEFLQGPADVNQCHCSTANISRPVSKPRKYRTKPLDFSGDKNVSTPNTHVASVVFAYENSLLFRKK